MKVTDFNLKSKPLKKGKTGTNFSAENFSCGRTSANLKQKFH
jgi:hypothetical protein